MDGLGICDAFVGVIVVVSIILLLTRFCRKINYSPTSRKWSSAHFLHGAWCLLAITAVSQIWVRLNEFKWKDFELDGQKRSRSRCDQKHSSRKTRKVHSVWCNDFTLITSLNNDIRVTIQQWCWPQLAVVVAQLAVRSLPTPEGSGLSFVIGKFIKNVLNVLCTKRKDENKAKEGECFQCKYRAV